MEAWLRTDPPPLSLSISFSNTANVRGWHHGVKRVVLRIQTDPEAEIPRPWLVWFVLTGWMKVWRWRKWLFINWHELWVDNTSPYLDMILPTVGMECGRRRHMSFRKAIMPKSNLRPKICLWVVLLLFYSIKTGGMIIIVILIVVVEITIIFIIIIIQA